MVVQATLCFPLSFTSYAAHLAMPCIYTLNHVRLLVRLGESGYFCIWVHNEGWGSNGRDSGCFLLDSHLWVWFHELGIMVWNEIFVLKLGFFWHIWFFLWRVIEVEFLVVSVVWSCTNKNCCWARMNRGRVDGLRPRSSRFEPNWAFKLKVGLWLVIVSVMAKTKRK